MNIYFAGTNKKTNCKRSLFAEAIPWMMWVLVFGWIIVRSAAGC